MRFDDIDNSIIAVINYGSYARGDNDKYSDYDIFILVSQEKSFVKKKINERLKSELNGIQCDISIYNNENFKLMKSQGSLFLWHLKNEGKILYKKNNIDLFEGLKNFLKDKEDIILYKKLVDSAFLSLNRNGINYYDLRILSLVVRNTLILLCYKRNDMSFGRNAVFNKAKKIFGDKLPLTFEIYNELNEYRLIYSRLLGRRKLPNKVHIKNLIKQIDAFLLFSMKIIGVNNNLDRFALLLKKEFDSTLYSNFEIFTEFERDLYISLMKLCKKEHNYFIKGLNDIHKNSIQCNLNNTKLNTSVEVGFTIYDNFQKLKESNVRYDKNLEDVFDNYLDPIVINCKEIFLRINNSKIKKKIKHINIPFIKNIISEFEEKIEKIEFLNILEKYCKHINMNMKL